MLDFDRHGKKGNSQKTRSKMANLQVMDAIQLIPKLDGSLDSFEQFLMLIDYYAEQNPEGEDQAHFLNLLFMKLKLKAAARIKRIYANTWKETKANLIREFGIKTTFGSVIEQIKTLEQGFHETFKSYANRILDINYEILKIDQCTGIMHPKERLRRRRQQTL